MSFFKPPITLLNPSFAPGVRAATAPRPASIPRLLILLTFLTLCCVAASAGAASPPEWRGGYAALEARRGDTSLHIKYMSAQGLVYSFADWSDELADAAAAEDAVSVAIVNPDLTGREPWPQRSSSTRELVVLQASEYRRFRTKLLSAVVPRGSGEAIAVAMGEQHISLFFDPEGRFQSVAGEPPEPMQVVARYSLQEYLRTSPAILEALLAELGVSAREVLFNTGDAGDDPLPFLYANLDTRVGAFVRVLPLEASPAKRKTLIPLTQSMAHLVRSHTTRLINTAFTSVTRLMFVVSNAARDTFDLAPLLVFQSAPVPPVVNQPGMDLAAWETDLDRMVGRSPDNGSIRYLIDGEAFFSRFEEAVGNARRSVLLRTYIFDNDDYAARFADLLRSRAEDGVEVKVLLDGLGTLSALAQPASTQPEDYVPPLSIHRYLEKDSDLRVRSIPNPFFTGDHTKTTIIDDELAYLGGMNIAREYRYEWHDMMVELRGPVVARLADDFDIAWATAGPLGDIAGFFTRLKPARDPGPELGHPVRVLYTRPTASEIRRTQLEAIRRSKQYVWVQNAYLTDDTFLLELVNARRRGVDVRVVIPLQSDRGQLTRDNILAANAMFKHGVRVYVYPGMSHIKAAIFDGWACLGSANLDQLSLRVNLETNIATSEPVAVNALKELLFERDFNASPEMQEVFPQRWNDRLWEMVGDYVF